MRPDPGVSTTAKGLRFGLGAGEPTGIETLRGGANGGAVTIGDAVGVTVGGSAIDPVDGGIGARWGWSKSAKMLALSALPVTTGPDGAGENMGECAGIGPGAVDMW